MRTPSACAGALALMLGCKADDAVLLGLAPDYVRPDAGLYAPPEPADSAAVGSMPIPRVCMTSETTTWRSEPLLVYSDFPCSNCLVGTAPRLSVDTDGSVWMFTLSSQFEVRVAQHFGADGTLLGSRQSTSTDEPWTVLASAVSGGHLYTYEVLRFEAGARAVLRVFDGALEEVAGPSSAPETDEGSAYYDGRGEESLRLAPHADGVMMMRFHAFDAEISVLDSALRVVDAWQHELSGYPEAFDERLVVGGTPGTSVPSEVVVNALDGHEAAAGVRLSIRRASGVRDELSLLRDGDGRAIVSGSVAREEPDFPQPDATRVCRDDRCYDPWLWVSRLDARNKPEFHWRIHAELGSRPGALPDGRVLVPGFMELNTGRAPYLAEISAGGETCVRSPLAIGVRALAVAPDGTVFYVGEGAFGVLVEMP